MYVDESKFNSSDATDPAEADCQSSTNGNAADGDLEAIATSLKTEVISLDEDDKDEEGPDDAGECWGIVVENQDADIDDQDHYADSDVPLGTKENDPYVDSDPPSAFLHPISKRDKDMTSTTTSSSTEFHDLFNLPNYSSLVNTPTPSAAISSDENMLEQLRANLQPSNVHVEVLRRYQAPLVDHGWKREVVGRLTGTTAKKADTYYYSPCGKKFRSLKLVQEYLDENGVTNLSSEDFWFNGSLIGASVNESLRMAGQPGRLSIG